MTPEYWWGLWVGLMGAEIGQLTVVKVRDQRRARLALRDGNW